METTLNRIDDKLLYKFAWFFEIFAVLIGIYLAISLSIGGIGDQPQTLDWINFGGIVLILLFGAFIELTKIPIIMAFNKTISTYRKSFMFLLFVCLCVFTFDTLFQGTEQYINFREKPIDEIRRDMLSIDGTRGVIDDKIIKTPLLSDEQIFKGFNLGFQEQAKNIDDKITRLEIRKTELENPADTPQINEFKKRRGMLILDKKNAVENSQASKKEYTEQLKILTDGGRKSQRRIPALQKQWDIDNKQFTSQISQIQNGIDEISVEINNLIKIQVTPNKEKIDNIDKKLTKKRASKEALLQGSQTRLEAKFALAITDREKVKTLKAKRESLDKKYQQLKDKFHEVAKENNIYRIGQRFFNKEHPADLTKEEIAIITLFLMITTATIFTFVGPGCAYFSLAENKKQHKTSKHQKGMLMKSIRSLLINLRKKVREPKIVKEIEEVEVVKEVFKEVPVEKIVIKEVEVPKPFEVTRYVGIPVPKDLEDLIEINNPHELELANVAAISGE